MQTQPNAAPVAVLIYPDPVEIRRLADLLGRNGLTVQSFPNAAAALAGMAPSTPPALVVTGLQLPDIDCWRLCRLLRFPAYAAFNRVPILVVSDTLAGDQAARITAEAGASAFLPLPVAEREFGEQVQGLLRGGAPARRPAVLIVEDDPLQATALKEEFEAGGYRADIARTGREAQKMFLAGAYAAVILDHHLPDLEGIQLLAELQPLRPDTVFVAVTGDSDPQLALEWIKQGAAAFVGKPCAPEDIVELCAKARRERELLRVEGRLEARTQESRRSEQQFRSLFDHALDGIIFSKPDGSIFAANPAACAMLGRSEREICAGGRQAVVDPADPRLPKVLAERARTGRYQGELDFVRGDGQAFPVEVSSVEYSSGSDGVVFCIIFHDISERQRAEAERRRSQERLEQLAEQSRTAIWEVDDQGLYTYASPVYHALLGYAPEELVGRLHFYDLHPAAGREAFKAAAFAVFARKEPFRDLENAGQARDGRIVWLSTNGIPILDQDGHLAGYRGADTDITERKRAEHKYRELFASSQDGIVHTDMQGMIVDANPAYLDMVG
jgi:PAS domain S-box-containing protein